MTVKLRLESGEIKEYRTWHERVMVGCEPTVILYFTKCGIRWDKKPSFDEGCDHLDCAMYAAFGGSNEEDKAMLIFLSLAGSISFFLVLLGIASWDYVRFWPGMAIVLGPLIFLLSCMDTKEGKELKEFRDHGTINGIKARVL